MHEDEDAAKVPLSPDTLALVHALFEAADRNAAVRLLETECGRGLPALEALDAVGLERYRFAALRLGGGSMESLRRAVDLAKTDWRDLLMAADFGLDVHAHEKWLFETMQTRGRVR
jgi:hypothetical protein